MKPKAAAKTSTIKTAQRRTLRSAHFVTGTLRRGVVVNRGLIAVLIVRMQMSLYLLPAGDGEAGRRAG